MKSSHWTWRLSTPTIHGHANWHFWDPRLYMWPSEGVTFGCELRCIYLLCPIMHVSLWTPADEGDPSF